MFWDFPRQHSLFKEMPLNASWLGCKRVGGMASAEGMREQISTINETFVMIMIAREILHSKERDFTDASQNSNTLPLVTFFFFACVRGAIFNFFVGYIRVQ
jgi:hypothetical protein